MASIFKQLWKFSFLLALILSLVFLYAQTLSTNGIFGEKAEVWYKYFTAYLVILALTLIASIVFAPKVVKKIATENYWRGFVLRFIPVFLVTAVILILIRGIFRGPASINILDAVNYLPITVILFEALVVTEIEELLFGGLIFTVVESKYSRLVANIVTIFAFAFLWHYSKSGGSLVVLATYIPLRMVFNYVRNNGLPILSDLQPKLFGATPITQQAAVGVHFAWNLFVISFIAKGGM